MSGITSPENVAKMKDGRCECPACPAGKHTDGRCKASSVGDPEAPSFEFIKVVDSDESHKAATWLWYCGPCAEVYIPSSDL
jgi:hypothetical protein